MKRKLYIFIVTLGTVVSVSMLAVNCKKQKSMVRELNLEMKPVQECVLVEPQVSEEPAEPAVIPADSVSFE